jgi:hypothetical protein
MEGGPSADEAILLKLPSGLLEPIDDSPGLNLRRSEVDDIFAVQDEVRVRRSSVRSSAFLSQQNQAIDD